MMAATLHAGRRHAWCRQFPWSRSNRAALIRSKPLPELRFTAENPTSEAVKASGA